MGVCRDEVRLMASPSLVSGDARRPSIGDPPGSRIRPCAGLRSIVANLLFKVTTRSLAGRPRPSPRHPRQALPRTWPPCNHADRQDHSQRQASTKTPMSRLAW